MEHNVLPRKHQPTLRSTIYSTATLTWQQSEAAVQTSAPPNTLLCRAVVSSVDLAFIFHPLPHAIALEALVNITLFHVAVIMS